jgi:O-antigen ligase
MVVWALFAVGGVYVWAGAPLMAAAAVLAVIARPTPGRSPETRSLDVLLAVSMAAIALQLVPWPRGVRDLISPQADAVRGAIAAAPAAAWRPVSVSPGGTAYALGLVLTALIVFWSARAICAAGFARQLVRHIAFAGLVASAAAIVMLAHSDHSLIYGRWQPVDAGARPFGPFVNRNHFATWVLMAGPLAMGYVAAALDRRQTSRRAAAKLAAFLEGLGTSVAWVVASVAVMVLALMISTSRSGLIGVGVSVAGAAWLARSRVTRRGGASSLAAIAVVAAFAAAYVNVEPLISRVEETMVVGAGGRSHIWRETVRLIRDFWLTGVGLGGYQAAMRVYQETNRAVFINQAHNQYLQLIADGGLLLTIPVWLSVAAFVELFRARMTQDTSPSVWLRIGGAAALLAVAVQGLWETGLRMPANGLLFAVAAAVAVHRPPLKRGSHQEPDAIPRSSLSGAAPTG